MSESHLQKKLRELGLSAEGGTTGKKCTFKLFFPRPPHDGIEYKAAKCAEGYNFVGLVLGHGGSTLQKVQKTTGAKIEIHDQTGNLNGSHPDLLDPSVHALIITDTPAKLEKASRMIADTLQPVNGKFQPFVINPGGAATLTPIRPKSATKKSQPVSLIGDAPKPSLQSTSKSDSGSSDESGTVTQTAEEQPANVWSNGQQHPFLSKSQDLDNLTNEQDNVENVDNVWGDANQSASEEQFEANGAAFESAAMVQSQELLFAQQQDGINLQSNGNQIENGQRDPENLQQSPYISAALMGEPNSNSNSNSDQEGGEDSGWSSWNDNQHQFFAVLQNELQSTLENVKQDAERFNGLPSGGPFPQYTGKNKSMHIRANSDGNISLNTSSSSSSNPQRLFFPQHSATFPQASFPSWSTPQTNTNNNLLTQQQQQQQQQYQQNNRHPNGNYSSPLLLQNRAQSVMTEFEKSNRNLNSNLAMDSNNSKFFGNDNKVKINGAGSGSLLTAKITNGTSGSSGQLQQSPQQLQQLQLQHHQQNNNNNHNQQTTVTSEHFASFLQH